jgi:putative tryptophan/tyrosine transport system substrate-binding protein
MRRREFIALAGRTAVAWPLAARAQQAHVPKIGVLVAGTPDPKPFWTTFKEAMHDLGYVEGRNIQFEYRSAEGDRSRLMELAADLVRDNVDIIVTFQTPTARAAKQVTQSIPIVMASAGDPVGTGLVASLARPGGNVTGMAGVTAELAGKSVELISTNNPVEYAGRRALQWTRSIFQTLPRARSTRWQSRRRRRQADNIEQQRSARCRIF